MKRESFESILRRASRQPDRVIRLSIDGHTSADEYGMPGQRPPNPAVRRALPEVESAARGAAMASIRRGGSVDLGAVGAAAAEALRREAGDRAVKVDAET